MAKKPQIGIYFSYSFVNIIEQHHGSIINAVKVPCILEDTKYGSSLPVGDELKIVDLINDTWSRSNISTRDVVLTILSRDLIIRFFEIPLVPHSEIESAIGFEAKKYMPFKLEELVFDFQAKIDKKSKKITVLFIAARREIIDKYISILEQTGLNIMAIEPVFLSTLRVLKSTNKIEAKVSVAIVDVNPQVGQGDITVIENLYPRFSHDLSLKIQPATEAASKETILSKLISEIRISLDYCRRQFPSSPININKLLLLASDDVAAWAKDLNKELEMPVVSVNIRDNIGSTDKEFDLGLTKAYGASLRDAVTLPLTIDLFAKSAVRGAAKGAIEGEFTFKKIALDIDKVFLVKNVLVALGIVLIIYLLGLGRINLYKNKIDKIKKTREHLTVLQDVESVTFLGLKKIETEYNKKISNLEALNKKRIYFTSKLSAIAVLGQEGLWLNNISFKDEGGLQKLSFNGLVYLDNEQKEFSAVHRFLSNFKKAEEFSNFGNISLVSLSHRTIEEYYLTDFKILCK